jgi:dipeptidase E
MKGKIYLIGGGEIAKGETKIIDESIKQSASKGSFFVFFPSAAGDSAGYINTIESVYGEYFEVIAATKEKGRIFVQEAIKKASVIYLGGGTTKLLLDFFKEWELTLLLREAYERGIIIAGMSAGAQALCAYYIHEEDGLFELRKGWGFAPMCCLVHANEPSFLNSKKLYSDFAEKDDIKMIGIGEKSAWCIDNSEEYSIGDGTIWGNQ